MGWLNRMMFSGVVGYLIGVRQSNENNNSSNNRDNNWDVEFGTDQKMSTSTINKDDQETLISLQTDDRSLAIHSSAVLKGDIHMDHDVSIGAFASLHGENAAGISIGSYSIIQDGVIIEGLSSFNPTTNDHIVNQTEQNQKKSVSIGEKTFLAYHSQIQGPAQIGENVYIGAQSLICHSEIGDHCVIAPGSRVIGVKLASRSFVPPGTFIKDQEEADGLPRINEDGEQELLL